MHCMKCGREISEGEVFCQDCLKIMAKYPVKPDTAVQIPRRRESASVRRAVVRRKTVSPEEQIRKLKRRLIVALAVWLITFLLLCAALYPLAVYLLTEERIRPGQNYSLIESQQSSAETDVSRETEQRK